MQRPLIPVLASTSASKKTKKGEMGNNCFGKSNNERIPLIPDADPGTSEPVSQDQHQKAAENNAELENKPWYHGAIDNKTADSRLQEGADGKDGAYLLYDDPLRRGQYKLLVYYKGDTLRWKIQLSHSAGGKYILGEYGPGVTGYATVKDLIKAHRGVSGRPIRIQSGGAVTLSKFYVCRPTKSW